jgi:hypothetical protein
MLRWKEVVQSIIITDDLIKETKEFLVEVEVEEILAEEVEGQ